MDNIPYGYCRCGCGQKTNLATQSYPKKGIAKGEPFQYVNGHRGAMGANNPKEGFWDNVDAGEPNECWNWKGVISPSGYGQWSVRGTHQYVHRIAWTLANNREIPEGMIVRHKCDNRACVNPAHLELGTHADNAADREERGRGNQAHGENAGNTKLTEEDVVEIRRQLANGMGRSELADRYGVSSNCIKDIDKRETWKHI